MKQLTSSEKCVIHRPVKTEIQVKSCSLFYAGIAQFGQSGGLIRLVPRVQILLPVPNVLIVQWIEHGPSKSVIQVQSLVGTPFMIYPTTVVRYIDTAGAKLPVMPWHRLKYECASFLSSQLSWIEHRPSKASVLGSTPRGDTIKIGEYAIWVFGRAVKCGGL